MSDLTEQIRKVHEARQKERELKRHYAELLEKWTNEHADMLSEITQAILSCEAAEGFLRDMTIAAYENTGDKKPAPGVGIREVTRLEYEPSDALDWAKEHSLALQLDKKAFEKIAKASMQMPFVTAITEPQATISPDLSEAIKEIQSGT